MHDFFQSHRDEICEKYLKPIGMASSKKDLADLLDINACEWMCQMNAKHGGVGEWVAANFGNFINGRFSNVNDGYDTSLYCGFKSTMPMVLRTTVTCFIDSEVDIKLQKYEIRRIVCSNSIVSVKFEDESHLLAVKDNGTEIVIEERDKSKITIKDL
jgi:hypothetical protein